MAGDGQSGQATAAFRATVRGGVQGVGFRWATVEQARQLGVLGWVRNQDDGTVAVHAEGPADAVAGLRAWLETGPPGASVEAVEESRGKVEGHEQFAIRGVSAGAFTVLQYGAGDQAGDAASGAGAPFYALAMQVDGAPVAWRLAKEPSLVPADKRFATQLTDGDGAPDGDPVIWDSGTYEQGGRVPWPEAIGRGHAVFVLHGDKLRGGFALQRTRGSGPQAGWLLIKRRDEFAAG